MRTIVDIPDKQIEFLKQLSEKKKISRAEIIRQALNNYIIGEKETIAGYELAFGSWQISSSEDGISYQQRLRKEWDK